MPVPALRKTAAAIALIGTFASAPASAAYFDLGTLNGTLAIADIPVVGEFHDTFSFIAGSQPGVIGNVTGIDLLRDANVQYRLWVGASPPPAALPWSLITPVVSDQEGIFEYSGSFSGLVPNQKYWFEFRGEASMMSYSVTLAPVPEPETLAMLLSGLGLMGFVARRRKATTS